MQRSLQELKIGDRLWSSSELYLSSTCYSHRRIFSLSLLLFSIITHSFPKTDEYHLPMLFNDSVNRDNYEIVNEWMLHHRSNVSSSKVKVER